MINTKLYLFNNAKRRVRQKTIEACKFGSSNAHTKLAGNSLRSAKVFLLLGINLQHQILKLYREQVDHFQFGNE